MSKIQKLFERIQNNNTNVSFEDLDRLLKKYGFKCRQPGGGSSHFTYTKKGYPGVLTIPRHTPMGEIYVDRVAQAILEYGNLPVDADEDQK